MKLTVLLKKIALLVTFICANHAAVKAQGKVDGFFKGKGNVDMVLGGGAEMASKFYAGTDRVTVKRTIINANIFIAAGITNKLDINASVPYIMINSEKNLQDASIFFKYKLLEKGTENGTVALAMAGGYSDNVTDYKTEGLNAIGQQAQILDGRMVFHYFNNKGWFYTAQSGFNYKSEPVPHAMVAAIKYGKASSNWYYDIWYDFQWSFGGLDYRGTPTPSTFRELGVNFHKVGTTVYKPISEHIGVAASAGMVLFGRNVGQGIGLNAAFIYKV